MMSYAELRLEMEGQFISYAMLLTTTEWQKRRLEIIRRDHHLCTQCGKGETMDEYDYERREVWYFWLNFEPERFIRKDGITYIRREKLDFEVASKPYYMQVHHKRYIRNRLPWQYDDYDLITLCNWCHSEFHEQYEVEVYAEDEVTLLEDYKSCKRCNGAGGFPEYDHVQGGVCFGCGGERYVQPLVSNH